jgi:AraC-like DNA-binding protein
MRTLCGPDWLPSEVHLRRKTPRDIDPYRRLFRVPLVFDAEHSAVVFSNSWLAEKVRQADPLLHKLVAGHVEMLLSRTDHDIVVRATHTLAHMLGSKQCSLAALARQMSLHPRTLHRRLEEGGTTFRELHRSTRHRLARQLLYSTENSIPEIAAILGFSGANAFTRAFMQWEGTPPAAWRRNVSRNDDQKAFSS